jgi:hypothetical protein
VTGCVEIHRNDISIRVEAGITGPVVTSAVFCHFSKEEVQIEPQDTRLLIARSPEVFIRIK